MQKKLPHPKATIGQMKGLRRYLKNITIHKSKQLKGYKRKF